MFKCPTGFQHSVVLKDLSPGENYHYVVNKDKGGCFTQPVGKGKAVRVAIFGDMGTSSTDGSSNGGVEDNHESLDTTKFLMVSSLASAADNICLPDH